MFWYDGAIQGILSEGTEGVMLGEPGGQNMASKVGISHGRGEQSLREGCCPPSKHVSHRMGENHIVQVIVGSAYPLLACHAGYCHLSLLLLVG